MISLLEGLVVFLFWWFPVERWMCRGGRKDILCFRIFVWEAAFCYAGWEITVQLIPLVTLQGLNLCGNKTLTSSGFKIPLYKLVHINSFMCVNLLCLLLLCNACLSGTITWNYSYVNVMWHGVSHCCDCEGYCILEYDTLYCDKLLPMYQITRHVFC